MTLARWGVILGVAAGVVTLAVSLNIPITKAVPVFNYQLDEINDQVQYLAERDIERELDNAENNLKTVNSDMKTAPAKYIPTLIKQRDYLKREIRRIKRRLKRIAK